MIKTRTEQSCKSNLQSSTVQVQTPNTQKGQRMLVQYDYENTQHADFQSKTIFQATVT